MSFMDSYKHLEKLCGEVQNDAQKITAYINEMESKPQGSYLVKGWDNDLKQLKHYRWIRNQIVHDFNCTEENMCNSADTDWIDKFYNRIMNQTDPLALYRKATKQQGNNTVKAKQNTITPVYYQYSSNREKPQKQKSHKAVGWVVFLSIGVLVLLLFAFNDYIF